MYAHFKKIISEIEQGNPVVLRSETEQYTLYAAAHIDKIALADINSKIYVVVGTEQQKLTDEQSEHFEEILSEIDGSNRGNEGLLLAKANAGVRDFHLPEAAITLCELAGFDQITLLIAEPVLDADIPQVTLEEVLNYQKTTKELVHAEVKTQLPTQYGTFDIIAYSDEIEGKEYVALVKGDVSGGENVMVRLHSECLTGDIFGSKRCDCGEQLHRSLEEIEANGNGVLIYLRQEGRGIGLVNKLKAYNLQQQGFDTVEANHKLGFADDLRDYAVAAQIIRDLKIKSVALLTNNPSKIEGLQKYGIQVNGRSEIEIHANAQNVHYLKTKKEKMGHLLKQVF